MAIYPDPVAQLLAEGWEVVTDPRAFSQFELCGVRLNGPSVRKALELWDSLDPQLKDIKISPRLAAKIFTSE